MFLIGSKANEPYVTVWSVEDKGNYVFGRISTSEKDNREEGKYINSNWFAKFLGKAKDKSMLLHERSRIKVLSGKIENVMYGEPDNRRSFLCVLIFDFEMLEMPGYYSDPSDTYAEDNLPF